MAEDINQVLGVEDKEPSTQSVTTSNDGGSNVNISNGAENTLETIAVTVLILGILASIICLFTICFIQDPKYDYIESKIFNPSGFATTIAILLSSITTWGLLKVISNISKTLKEINKKMK